MSFLIKRPWITEKSTNFSKLNQYAFLVADTCNKQEAKKAIEAIYGVDITKMNSVRTPGKRRRLGASTGFKSGHKKVVVTLKQGQTIDILPH
ncbi:MAG: 50S ribosomal protein L23 [Parcubacteria group bacterium RIFCSPLOWO2_01_FULL_48_18]|nr:MAG: 50S ribosomal protein L23 [Parcubacteria group bacterium RIFCSPLOWO2_01_FULL_48_18]OHB24162.1 MAG: 50S ribosomal protein L23 [Parcubacteria group bacterium RIFCSPHIGHO2_02_FULL_48_10b]